MDFLSKSTFLVSVTALYIAWRGRQAFVSTRYKRIYWLGCLALLSSIILIISIKPDTGVTGTVLTWLGSYSIGAFFYAFLLVLLLDILRKADNWWGFIPYVLKRSPSRVCWGIIILVACILAFGTWNAWHPVLQSYEINIAKKVDGAKDLHVVMVSDLHLGTIVNRDRLSHIVELINRQNPDLIILAGDVVDGSMRPFNQQHMGDILLRLKPKLGTFMVMGNHDIRTSEALACLQAAGITVLLDQCQLVDNRFYLVGRDYRRSRVAWFKTDLNSVMKGINHDVPIILIDHNPTNLEEALAAGVDLQLSGHTHRGQMFPNNLVTASTYEVDWGYLQKERLQVVVSSGIGTTGPPIRIGSTPELVDLMIHFQ